MKVAKDWQRDPAQLRKLGSEVTQDAGYSGTPMAMKLGVKDGGELALLDAPASWSVPELPERVTVARVTAAFASPRQGSG